MTLSGRTIDPDACTSPALRTALAYWERVRGDRAMPTRADILPEEIPQLLAQAMMIRVERDPFEMRWSVFGGRHADGAGQDFTGRSVRDIRPAALANLAWRQYAEAVEAGRPTAHCMEVRTPGGSASCQRISLPLSADGETVDRLLVVTDTPRAFWEAVRSRRRAAAG